ncbi:MAG TPA: efflux RND transporter periplasmic adaptor subunit, partial [Chryseolinea sp.]|nr:efflux RND transporter periplasmic adaptor subunit [Chryseolinea sp.]
MRKNWRNRQSTKYEIQGTRFEVRGTSYEVRGTRGEMPIMWYETRNTNTAVPRTSYLVPFLLSLIVLLARCTSNHEVHNDIYTCPMHPTVISDKPGTCPVCGMNLVLKGRAGEEVEITEGLSKLITSPNEIVVSSIKTIKGQYKSVPVFVEAQGVVTYDTRNIYTIPSRVGGRLEKIYLKYAFQAVSKGQKIADIYSPELITAQRELLFLLENDADNKSLIEATKNKLNLLGMTNSQIHNLIERKETSNTFSVYSPYSGYLITDQQPPSTSVAMLSGQATTTISMNDGMGSTSSNTSAAPAALQNNSNSSIIREGNYVSAGQTLFKVVNTDALRVELDLPAKQSGSIKKGDKLELDFGTGHKEQTSVDFVQPFFNEGQDFVKLRVYTKKVEGLHIGHLVTATIRLSPSESLWVPKESVLDLGADKIVFVKDHGVLKPKKIIT